jgi:hypothetical protein
MSEHEVVYADKYHTASWWCCDHLWFMGPVTRREYACCGMCGHIVVLEPYQDPDEAT